MLPDCHNSVARERAGGFEAGRAGEGRFDRKRHLFLDLNRQERPSDGVNLDLDIGHVRHGIDRGGGDSCSARPPRDAVHKMATELENYGPPRFQGGVRAIRATLSPKRINGVSNTSCFSLCS
jgi:hypothetical protein